MLGKKIIKLNKEDAPEIVNVLCDSFYNYPVMRYVLENVQDYERRLHTLIHFFVMARIFRNETAFGVKDHTGLIAVATTSNPALSLKIQQLAELKEKTWHILGAKAKERYEKLGRIWAKLDTGVPNIHLNMLGVRHDAQRTGAGRLLLEQVRQFSLNNPDSRGVTLTTEDQENVGYYEYMGYKITGYLKVDNNLETWNFFRPD